MLAGQYPSLLPDGDSTGSPPFQVRPHLAGFTPGMRQCVETAR